MILPLQKYHGARNDFIMIDNREGQFDGKNSSLIQKMCDRRFGIGADGLILISTDKKFDFSTRYFNADGKEASMCGNGGRCAVAFAHKLKMISSEKSRFKAVDGLHEAILIDQLVRLKMSNVNKIEITGNHYFLNTGSPHLVRFVKNLDTIDVFAEGRKIRNDKKFGPEGTNVNFVKVIKGRVHIRTYERGVEDETYACGTGSVAAALAVFVQSTTRKHSYDIIARGGQLKVNFTKGDNNSFHDIWLEGPAQFVFKGNISG